MRRFHNKSVGDKDSSAPTVYDPLDEHMPMTRGAPLQQVDTKVSVDVQHRAAQRPVQASLIDRRHGLRKDYGPITIRTGVNRTLPREV